MTNNQLPGFEALTWLVIAIAIAFIVTPLACTFVDHRPGHHQGVQTP